jgi:hypothetical protein
MPEGFRCRVVQRDAGHITFAIQANSYLRNVDGHTKTKGPFAFVDLTVMSDTTGTNAVWYLTESTAA